MTPPAQTGRRPGSPDTRAEVLAAARRRFAEDGYGGASIRDIAAEAEVDPALVHHYFGTKRDLFRQAASFPITGDDLADVLVDVPAHERGSVLARAFFSVWEDDATRYQLLSVLRSAMTHEDAAALLRAFVSEGLLQPVADRLDIEDAAVRIPLAASQMLGLAILRYVVQVEPIASMTIDEVVDRVSPVLDHHLFGAAFTDEG